MKVKYDSVNHVIKIIIEDNGFERHYTFSDEGLIADIVEDGEVVKTKSWEHDDLLEAPIG
jgi:uncharacterized protein YuzE